MKTLLNFFRQSQFLAIFLGSVILLTAADFDFSSSPDAPAKLAQFNARSASEGPTRLASPNELSPSGQCTPHPESAMGVSTSLVLSCETHPKMRVALYSGQGIMDKSYDYWEFALKKIFTDLEIFMISADAIKEGGLTNNNFSLLIIPGGQASLYRQDLDERAIGKMNGFIAQGGKCLAVGGGAYFFSDHYTFKSPIPTYQTIDRDGAGMCNTTAYGPFSPIGNEKIDTSGRKFFPVRLTAQSADEKPHMAFSYCGCYFSHTENQRLPIDILARSQKTLNPVVIGQSHNIVLSGIHPEFNSFIAFPQGADQWHELSVDESANIILLHMLRYLGLVI